MLSLPLIERDLRIRSRRWGTYWLRAGVGLLGVLVCVPQLISLGAEGLSQDIGKDVFRALVAALFFVCCGACLLTSDAIGLERRERTLSLLMLTRVRGLDLLLGKFGASAVAGLCVMCAFMPVLMLPVLAGGVTGGEAFRTSFALLNTLFFALASGLFASSIQGEQVKAGAFAIMIVLFFALVPLVFWLAGPPLLSMGPLAAILSAEDNHYAADGKQYWMSIASVHAAGWILLLSAAGHLREKLGSQEVLDEFLLPDAHIRPSRRRKSRRFESDPIGWVVRNQRGIRAPLWWATAIVVIYVAGAQLGPFYSPIASWMFYGVCSTATDALLAVAAGRFFVENGRSGQLELLLTTPLGAKTILDSQWRAMKALLGWPVAIWISAIMLQSTAWLALWDVGPMRPTFFWGAKYVITWGFDIAGTILGVFLVCWIGMWVGLRTQSRLAIAGWAAALSTGVPALFRLLFGITLDPLLAQSLPQDWGLVSMWLEQLLLLIYFIIIYRFLKRRLLRALSTGPSLMRTPKTEKLKSEYPRSKV